MSNFVLAQKSLKSDLGYDVISGTSSNTYDEVERKAIELTRLNPREVFILSVVASVKSKLETSVSKIQLSANESDTTNVTR